MTALRQAGLERRLDAAGLAEAACGSLKLLGEDVAADLAAQDADLGRRDERILLHYDGADASLPVALGTLAEVKAGFEAAHRRLFGFVEDGLGRW